MMLKNLKKNVFLLNIIFVEQLFLLYFSITNRFSYFILDIDTVPLVLYLTLTYY